MNGYERPSVAQNDAIRAGGGCAPVSAQPVIEKATRMHEMVRMRARHFAMPMMADDAMAIMLSLLIAQLQELAVTDFAVVRANDIVVADGEAMMNALIQAGLVVVTGEKLGQRLVGLTPVGVARMRTYVGEHPDI